MTKLALWRNDNGTYDVVEDGLISHHDIPKQLLGAAPEMLAALKWYVASRRKPANPSKGYLNVLAAIALAEGKTP